MAMKVVRQARLELSGGSTPDQLRPTPPLPPPPPNFPALIDAHGRLVTPSWDAYADSHTNARDTATLIMWERSRHKHRPHHK